MSSEVIDIVVGGGSGMGAAAARALRGRGRRLIVADKNGDAAADVAAPLGAEPVEVDLVDPASVARLAERIPALGSMIVTAGINVGPDRRLIDVNLVGPALLMDALTPKVIDGSAVVLFSSMVELMPIDPALEDVLDAPLAPDLIDRLIEAGAPITDDPEGQVGYLYGKIGVHRLARRKAIEWWPRGGRVNSISPGVIDTPMIGKVAEEHRSGMFQMAELVGRLGRPEEVGRVAAFLVSPDASFVNGINLTVSGGLTTIIQEQQRAASRGHVA